MTQSTPLLVIVNQVPPDAAGKRAAPGVRLSIGCTLLDAEFTATEPMFLNFSVRPTRSAGSGRVMVCVVLLRERM